MLAGGAWGPSQTEDVIELIDPSEGEVFAAIARGGAGDIDLAVKTAREAFEKHWESTPAFERGRYLSRVAGLISDQSDELASIESQDTGKPLKQSRVDCTVAARYFEYYAGAADKLHGESIPFLDDFQVFTRREAHGVTAHIIPWNYPLQMAARTFAATLAAGNAMVIKPAEQACLSVIRLAELLLKADLPADVINVVTGYGDEAGASLAQHKGVDHICFTGSPEVGTLVQTAAAAENRSCTMELGGKSPQIVFADAELDLALPAIINAIIQSAGQTCSAGSRLLVQESLYDKFMPMLAERFSELQAGAALMDLDLGPLISDRQRTRVQDYLDEAESDGVPVIARGLVVDAAPKTGYYLAPVMLGPVPRANRVASEEIFGPVLSVIPFEDEADVIRLANSTVYGLTAGIWTKDGGRQMRVAKALKCGQVFINSYGAGGGVELPFGGFKRSGFGREKGMEALHELTACKTIVHHSGT